MDSDPVLLQHGNEASHSKAYNPLGATVTDKSYVESEYDIFLFLFVMIFDDPIGSPWLVGTT
jgi:hypothetical protein